MRSMLFKVAFLALLAGGCADAGKPKPAADEAKGGGEPGQARAGEKADSKTSDVKHKGVLAVARADDRAPAGMWRQLIRNSDKEPWRHLALVQVVRDAKGLTLAQLDYTVVKR